MNIIFHSVVHAAAYQTTHIEKADWLSHCWSPCSDRLSLEVQGLNGGYQKVKCVVVEKLTSSPPRTPGGMVCSVDSLTRQTERHTDRRTDGGLGSGGEREKPWNEIRGDSMWKLHLASLSLTGWGDWWDSRGTGTPSAEKQRHLSSSSLGFMGPDITSTLTLIEKSKPILSKQLLPRLSLTACLRPIFYGDILLVRQQWSRRDSLTH